jgi:hypothetical protein
LYYNGVLSISWIPWQIVYDFSIEYYWLILPKTNINQIIPLLRILPFTMVHLSENNTFIWTYLSPEIAQWIKKYSNWEMYEVKRYISQQKAQFNWFNEEKLEWITPYILG